VDDNFDPNMHDALFNIPDADSAKSGTIGTVVKSGYKLKDRVIRAAQVGARVSP
jgi:molecular chaperone GrpE